MKLRVLFTMMAMLVFALSVQAQTPATSGTIFDPADFTSLGPIAPAGGDTVTFDTDALTVDGAGFSTVAGALGVSATSQTEVAVFCFDSIDFSAGTVVMTGSRPIALLSKANVTIDIVLDGIGADGFDTTGSGDTSADTPAPGRLGGFQGDVRHPNNNAQSLDDTLSTYDPAAVEALQTTDTLHGPGRGLISVGWAFNAGGGGAYGGVGGQGGENDLSSTSGGDGGSTYLTSEVLEPLGGSGGAGGRRVVSGATGWRCTGGGAGGGFIQISAAGDITIGGNGRILVDGGNGGNMPSGFGAASSGGGGSGGAVMFNCVNFSSTGYVSANGGNGGAVNGRTGGGGGGGRIVVNATGTLDSGWMTVDGGLAGEVIGSAAGVNLEYPGFPGEPGTFFPPSVPVELSTFDVE